ncbi:MAG: hypothetical protein GTN36_04290 [Candidatus Aenigmarchaeota archaeon]|nr:hypothetical protein [Candidatus Aenigmarchaeota archaeon]
MLKQCIDNKDLRKTGVSIKEFIEFLRQQGYEEKKARLEVSKSLDRLKVHMPRRWAKKQTEEGEAHVKRYFAGETIRRMGEQFLSNHSEIEGVQI